MKICFLLYFVFFPFTILAQPELNNTSLTQPQLNLLYRNVDNAISISGIENDTASLMLTATNAEVLRNDSTFIIRPNDAVTDTLRLYRNQQLLLTKVYQVKDISGLILRLGNISGGSSAKVKEILKDPVLNLFMPDSYYDHGISITSFSMVTSPKRDRPATIDNDLRSPRLTKRAIANIKSLKKGDQIIFYDIRVYNPRNENPRNVHPLFITGGLVIKVK